MPHSLPRSLGFSRAPFLLAAGLFVGCAQEAKTEPKGPEQAQVEKTVTAKAKVVSLDKETRLVVLRGETGNTWLVRAGDEVRNFAQIQPGDSVRVDYQTVLAVALKKPGEALAVPTLAVAAGRAEPGRDPAGGVAAQVTTTVRIESIDTTNNIVVFTPLGGGLEAARVQTPQGRQFLRGLRVGDRVEITYTEAVAVALEKQQ